MKVLGDLLGTVIAAAMMLFVAACLVGCELTVDPRHILDLQIDPARVIPAPEGAAEAEALLMQHLGPGPAYPVVWYSPGPDDVRDGITQPDSPLSDGLTIVVYRPGQAIHETALAHERLHWRNPGHGHPAALFGDDYAATGIDGGYAKFLADELERAGL